MKQNNKLYGDFSNIISDAILFVLILSTLRFIFIYIT